MILSLYINDPKRSNDDDDISISFFFLRVFYFRSTSSFLFCILPSVYENAINLCLDSSRKDLGQEYMQCLTKILRENSSLLYLTLSGKYRSISFFSTIVSLAFILPPILGVYFSLYRFTNLTCYHGSGYQLSAKNAKDLFVALGKKSTLMFLDLKSTRVTMFAL